MCYMVLGVCCPKRMPERRTKTPDNFRQEKAECSACRRSGKRRFPCASMRGVSMRGDSMRRLSMQGTSIRGASMRSGIWMPHNEGCPVWRMHKKKTIYSAPTPNMFAVVWLKQLRQAHSQMRSMRSFMSGSLVPAFAQVYWNSAADSRNSAGTK